MKAHTAKMHGNEGPEGQKLQNGAGYGTDKSIVRTLGKRAIFGNMRGGGQKPTPKMPKCKEIKTHKAKMQGNEGPQGQNARK